MPPSRWLSMQPQPVKIFRVTLMHVNGYKCRSLITCFVLRRESDRRLHEGKGCCGNGLGKSLLPFSKRVERERNRLSKHHSRSARARGSESGRDNEERETADKPRENLGL